MTAPARLDEDPTAPPALRIAVRALVDQETPARASVWQSIQRRTGEPARLLEGATGEPTLDVALQELTRGGPRASQRMAVKQRVAAARAARSTRWKAVASHPKFRFGVAVSAALFASSAAAAIGWLALARNPSEPSPTIPSEMRRGRSPASSAPERGSSSAVDASAPPAPPNEPAVDDAPKAPALRPAARDRQRSARTGAERRGVAGPDALAELTLVSDARMALPVDPRRALSLADEHRRRYPEGTLGQESDRIRIEALVSLQETERAAREAERFRHRYPGSPYLRQLEALTAGDQSSKSGIKRR